jgi:hypothetical protein
MANTASPSVKHSSSDEYDRLEALGVFSGNKRVELIHGQIDA